jgi:hypothetical protein
MEAFLLPPKWFNCTSSVKCLVFLVYIYDFFMTSGPLGFPSLLYCNSTWLSSRFVLHYIISRLERSSSRRHSCEESTKLEQLAGRHRPWHLFSNRKTGSVGMLPFQSEWTYVAPLNSSLGDNVDIAKRRWLMEFCSLGEDAVAYLSPSLIVFKINS